MRTLHRQIGRPLTRSLLIAAGAAVSQPKVLDAPTFTGSAIVGETLNGTQGTWTNATTVTSSWLRDGVPVGDPQYTVVADDLGKRLTWRVTATGPGGQRSFDLSRIVAYPGIGAMRIGSSNVVGLTDIKFTEVSANSGGTWGARDGASIEFLGDTAYMIGGFGGAPFDDDWVLKGGTTCNQVYRSDNFGLTWVRIREQDLTPDSTHFTPRHTFNSLVHNVAGTDYIYIFGGDIQQPSSAVLRSTDGINWSVVAAEGSPGWDGISLSFAGKLDGDIYLAGGSTDLTAPNHTSAVWRSIDDGATWLPLGNAPWAPRSTIDRMPTFLDHLWVIGGGVYDPARQFFNDVWNFDGLVWTQVLPNGHSQFPPMQYSNVFVFDGWMYLLFGWNSGLGNNQNVCYRTRDGANWFSVAHNLVPSHAHGVGVHPTRGVLLASGAGYLETNQGTPSIMLEFK